MRLDKNILSKIVSTLLGCILITLVVVSFQNFTSENKIGQLNTIYWTVFFIFLFFAFIIPLLEIFSYLSIKQIIEKNEMKSLKERISAKKALSEIWKDYEKTFIENSSDPELIGKTRSNADLYFSVEEILSNSYCHFPIVEFQKIIPGTFIGLGILGTFMGFSQFLGNFIDGGINLDSFEIFDGLKVAFNTSIIGILSSIIYNFLVSQPNLYLINKGATDLSDALDNEYYVSDEKCMRSLGNIVSITEKSIKTNINKMVSDIKDVITEERHQFTEQVLGTADRLKEIDNSLENIPRNIQIMDKELNKSISLAQEKTEQQLKLTLNSIDTKVNEIFGKFATQFSESSDIIQDTVKSLNDFQKRIDSTITSANDKFNQNIAVVFSQTEKNIQVLYEGMTSNIKQMLNNETESNIESTKKLLSDTESRFMLVADRMNAEFSTSVAGINKSFETLVSNTKTDFQELNLLMKNSFENTNEQLASSVKESVTQLELMTDKIRVFTDQYNQLETSLAEVSSRIVDSEESFTKTSTEIKSLFKQLVETAMLMKDSQQLFADMSMYLRRLPEQQKEMERIFNIASDKMKESLVLLIEKTSEVLDKQNMILTESN